MFSHLLPPPSMRRFQVVRQKQDLPPPSPSIPRKYWSQRYRYFSLFDKGIQLDAESFYSVTPEALAIHIAKRMQPSSSSKTSFSQVCVDWFCGCGGNLIQMAKEKAGFCIGCDIDGAKLRMAGKNAAIYGVDSKIDFVKCNSTSNCFREDADFLDICLLAPPWGGVSYEAHTFSLERDIRLLTDRRKEEDGEEEVEVWDGRELWQRRAWGRDCSVYMLPRNCPLGEYFRVHENTHLHFNEEEDEEEEGEEEERVEKEEKERVEEVELLFLQSNLKMKVVYKGPGLAPVEEVYPHGNLVN